MSDNGRGRGNGNGDGSSLDDVPEEDVEQLEESVDTENLDEEDLVSLDDAARALLARKPKGHGPFARLYRGETRFDFVGKRKIWFSISTAIIVLGIISIVLRGGLNLGIEFKGGTEWTIAAPGVTQTQATNALKNTGVIDPTVELLGSGSKQTLNVQSDLNKLPQAQQTAVSTQVQKAMLTLTASDKPTTAAATTTSTTAKPTTTTTAKAGAAAGSTTTSVPTTTTTSATSSVGQPLADKISITTVGPTWGSSITNKAIEALIIFFIVVAIYISIRFEPKMALAAFIAMIHDVLVAIGIYSIFNFQVTPDTVVAILTILGYSLYDTVVVFDRVRDNTKGIGSSGRLTYPQLINLSMNQTLARSINTSAVAIMPVLSVLVIGSFVLGATSLQDFGLALVIGLTSGAYSSIFIASPLLALMKEREPRYTTIRQRLETRGERGAVLTPASAAAMAGASAGGGSGRASGRTRAQTAGVIRPGAASSARRSGSAARKSNQPVGASTSASSGGTKASTEAARPASGSTRPGGNRPPPRPRKGKGGKGGKGKRR